MWHQLKQETKPIVLYGMGDGADKILDQCQARGIPVAGVFASDGFVRHNEFRGYTVLSYQEACARFGPMTVLVAFGTHQPDVMARIRAIAAAQTLYLPDLPVAGGPLFDRAFALAHRAELEAVYRTLADEVSRQTFRDLLSYKLSWRSCYLDRCQMPPGEMDSLLCLGPQEHYADLGAYRGDTIAAFLRQTGGQYASILALEPDGSSYQKLCRATAALPRCRCVQAAAAAQAGTAEFRAGRGRGSRRGQGRRVACAALDELLQGAPVTYLNIDVEGQESAALAGAAESIARWQPRILLAAYHRSEDLFALPLQVLQLVPSYRVYLRRAPCYPAWEINYIFTPAPKSLHPYSGK